MSTVKKGLNIAIEGCGHGALDQIYATMKQLEAQTGKAIDLLICCGDFQVGRCNGHCFLLFFFLNLEY